MADAKYIFMTVEDSIKTKDWAAGSIHPCDSSEFIFNIEGSLEYKIVNYPPALMKMMDEPIVNVIDQMVDDNSVTYLTMNIDNNGKIDISNDGSGITLDIHNAASTHYNRSIYAPELIFGYAFQGSNSKTNINSIVGGTNGLGIKICNCHSTSFEVMLVTNGTKYTQKWTNGMKNITAPQFETTKERNIVRIIFVPNYKDTFKYNNLDNIIPLLKSLVYTRLCLASAYINYALERQITIKFDDNDISFTLDKFMMRSMSTSTLYSTYSIAPKTNVIKNLKLYTIKVDLLIANTKVYDKSSLCVVNGIVVDAIQFQMHLLSAISKAISSDISSLSSSKITPKFISKHVFMCITMKMPYGAIRWTGQRKDTLKLDPDVMAQYIVSADMINFLLPYFRDLLIVTKPVKKSPIVHETKTYTPATFAGTKKSSECMLILAEGNSAMTQVKVGISKHYNWDYYGVMSLQGVIMNVRKECVKNGDINGFNRYVTSSKFKNSKFIKDFFSILGLDIKCTYNTDISSLKYGGVIACVDQDLDGKGNILGLIINMFEYFWPSLIARGFVKWFQTPIIRAYPVTKGKVLQFYNTIEFDKWNANNTTTRYNIRYYKGLSTHDRAENISMFKDMKNNLLTFYRDTDTASTFEIYYSKNTSGRKVELSKPAYIIDESLVIKQASKKEHSCTDHAKYEIKPYQLDNISRKLIHIIDGQNQSGRKILDGIIKAFAHHDKNYKANQLAGYISSKLNYHHGEAGLADSIINRAFIGVGGKQLPLLVPKSQTGTRFEGGGDSGDARYVEVNINKHIVNCIFPHEDYTLLEFNFDENTRVEPKYFIPIVPMAILENTSLPATGWKLTIWARDVISVIHSIRNIIKYDVYPVSFPPATYKNSIYEWKGTFKYIYGKLYSFGVYKYDDIRNQIIITELPYCIWTANYIADITKKIDATPNVIKKIQNHSDDINIKIIITLHANAYDLLEEYDDTPWYDRFESYFKLKSAMIDEINLINIDDSVISCESYTDIIKPWYNERKRLYTLRINRQIILNNIQLIRLDNMIRYITECKEIFMATKKVAEMIENLSSRKYAKLDHVKLKSPDFIKNEDLVKAILESPNASYDYLLNLSDHMKSQENLDKLKDERDKLKNTRLTYDNEKFVGANVWLDELDLLEKNIVTGMRTEWKYDKYDVYQY